MIEFEKKRFNYGQCSEEEKRRCEELILYMILRNHNLYSYGLSIRDILYAIEYEYEHYTSLIYAEVIEAPNGSFFVSDNKTYLVEDGKVTPYFTVDKEGIDYATKMWRTLTASEERFFEKARELGRLV